MLLFYYKLLANKLEFEPTWKSFQKLRNMYAMCALEVKSSNELILYLWCCGAVITVLPAKEGKKKKGK